MISSFSGRYAFLSNFFIDSGGFCAEIEFQACKATNEGDRDYILDCYKLTPYKAPREAKRRGRKIVCRHDWEKLLTLTEAQTLFEHVPKQPLFGVEKHPFKVYAMFNTDYRKFSSVVMRGMLLSTDNVELIEGNWWHDVYWGMCDGSGKVKKCPGHPPYGENILGKIEMEIRNELR